MPMESVMNFTFKMLMKEGIAMHQCISVYPCSITEQTIAQLNQYLQLAQQYGVHEVFTSIHLPEYSMEDQLSFLELTAKAAHHLKMELTADIGGPFIRKALEDKETLDRLKNVHLDYLRLDYGYSQDQLRNLYHHLHLKGFVINASMVSETQLQQHMNFFKSLDENIFIRACHNFYVREESGLDKEFALAQTKLFKKYNVPVYFCVPSYTHPRGPLHLGLPTLEHHRFQEIDYILMDVMTTYQAQGILYSDEWMSENLFKIIHQTIEKRAIQIPVVLNENLTEIEKRIILKKHIFRYDSNTSFLRSRSSREMAEFAYKINPKNCVIRKAGFITIDNEHYLRYSGELQVVLKDAKEDHRVNVAAKLKRQSDLMKFSFFREGFIYEFIEAD